MGTEAFGRALEAMVNDSGAAETIAVGDFTTLGDHDLTPAEQALLQAAAGDLPDVVGFSGTYFKLGYIGETEKNVFGLDDAANQFGERFREAAEYYRFELED